MEVQSKNGLVRAWLLVLLLIVVLGSVTFLGWKYLQKTNTQPINPIVVAPSSVVSWKTYTNNIYNFSIKYPSQYNIKEDNYAQPGEDPSVLGSIEFTDASGGVLVSINVNDKNSLLVPNGMNSIEAQKTAQKTTIGEKPGEIFSDGSGAGYGVKTDDYVYKIYTENKTLIVTVKTMVDSFKFLTPSFSTTGWKTFNSQEQPGYDSPYKYGFKYPSDYKVIKNNQTKENSEYFNILNKNDEKIVSIDYSVGGLESLDVEATDETVALGSNIVLIKTLLNVKDGSVFARFYMTDGVNFWQKKFDPETDKNIREILSTLQYKAAE